MPSKVQAVRDLLSETVSDWREDRASRLAAALAYYATFSLAPMLILVIVIAGSVIGDSRQVSELVVVQVQAAVGQQAADIVATLTENAHADEGDFLAGAISTVMLLLGATGVFGQLLDALNTIWKVEVARGPGIWGLVKERFLSLAMVIGVGFLLVISLMTSAVISFVNAHLEQAPGSLVAIVGLLNIGVSLGVATVVFAAVFKVLPDIDIAWKDVGVGALFTAVLFTAGKELLGVYLGGSSLMSVYGAAGSLVGILAWVYYSSQILFFGAEFTQVYARRLESPTDSNTLRRVQN